ncbi:HEAT repeat domain-containing protein, partial [Roseisolibacter sp. H3M3-2]|uniref:HEAT repeat domain-containing protein n=1 Tax=Roseisolibacter sp. H3M3-2 TaxID=3031323 RepID=UPI0023DAFFFD
AAAEAMAHPEVQGAIAGAGQAAAAAGVDAARAATEGLRAGAEAMRNMNVDVHFGQTSSRRGRNPNCRDENDDERVIALNALQQMDAERAMPLLRKVLARREECTELLRRRAVFIVAQKKTPETADILVNVARTDPMPEVREEAVRWLSRVGGDRALEFLRDVARSDTSTATRRSAVSSLAQSRDPKVREILRSIATTREVPAEVRGDALYYSVTRNDSSDVTWARTLFPTLESRELKERALSGFSRRRDSQDWLFQVARDGREAIEVRKTAFAYASRNATLPQLVELWDATKERELKEPLLVALSRRKEPEALDKLIAIARNEQDRELRKNAVYWLSRSNEPRALAFIQELIDK